MPTGIPIDGKVLRRLRKDRLWSQEDLATRARRFAASEHDLQCGLDKITITKYETGARSRVGWRNLRYLVGALRPTRADLTLLLGGDPPPGLTDLVLDLEEDGTDRRHTLKAGLTAIGQLLLPQISGYSLPPVEEFTALTHRYRRWDQHLPSWKLTKPVTNPLRFLDDLYRDTPVSSYRRDLAGAVSEAAGLAGWLAMDMDDTAGAHRHYQHAIRAADAASDPMLSGYMLGSLSWLAAYLGDGDSAIALIQAAKTKIGPLDTPATSVAWLAVHEALAYAVADNTLTSLRLLEAGAEAAQRSASETPVWPWLHPFSAHKLAAFRGSCHLRLGRVADAHAALEEALRSRPAGTRERATVLIDLVATHLTSAKPDVDEVCHLLGEAGGIAASTGSARLWREVRDGRTQLQPFRSSRAVQDLDDVLASLGR